MWRVGFLWKKLMHNSNKRGVEGGFFFCVGWNFSKSVNMGCTFIREMRVAIVVILRTGITLAL